jgi:hypothetical protein
MLPEGGESLRNEEDPSAEMDPGNPETYEILRRSERDKDMGQHKSEAEKHPDQTETFQVGDHLVTENEDGDVLAIVKAPEDNKASEKAPEVETGHAEDSPHAYAILKKKLGVWMHRDEAEGEPKTKEPERKRGPAFAYQFGNTVRVLSHLQILANMCRSSSRMQMARWSRNTSSPRKERGSQALLKAASDRDLAAWEPGEGRGRKLQSRKVQLDKAQAS